MTTDRIQHLERTLNLRASELAQAQADRDRLWAALEQAVRLLNQSAWHGDPYCGGDSERYAQWVQGQRDVAAILKELSSQHSLS